MLKKGGCFACSSYFAAIVLFTFCLLICSVLSETQGSSDASSVRSSLTASEASSIMSLVSEGHSEKPRASLRGGMLGSFDGISPTQQVHCHARIRVLLGAILYLLLFVTFSAALYSSIQMHLFFCSVLVCCVYF